ncbi:MAG: hypothetical protein JWO81_1578 [Alphaproteobacteria bacterium]|nr:hypothetical protein [Alphaproteobacteria bacterium]
MTCPTELERSYLYAGLIAAPPTPAGPPPKPPPRDPSFAPLAAGGEAILPPRATLP